MRSIHLLKNLDPILVKYPFSNVAKVTDEYGNFCYDHNQDRKFTSTKELVTVWDKLIAGEMIKITTILDL